MCSDLVSRSYTVADVMSTPVASLCGVTRVGDVLEMLKSNRHNGFPVIGEANPKNECRAPPSRRLGRRCSVCIGWVFAVRVPLTCGPCSLAAVEPRKFRGLVLRSQLITMLQLGCFGPIDPGTGEVQQRLLHHKDFVHK